MADDDGRDWNPPVGKKFGPGVYHKKHRPGFTKAQKLANAAWEAKYITRGMSDPDTFIRSLPKAEETTSAKQSIEEAKKRARIEALNKLVKGHKLHDEDD
jgi:hypothetical protein